MQLFSIKMRVFVVFFFKQCSALLENERLHWKMVLVPKLMDTSNRCIRLDI